MGRSQKQSGSTRLPPFMGKESWIVYYNRFQEIADRKGWNDEQCLDELLPRLQGGAGEFVFNQLSRHIRQDYRALIKELNSRFRVIENPRTFQIKFSHRDQLPNESVENFVADLKRLYDKAHPKRDHRTRNEDLLRRFLDGLSNDKASFHVEHIKGPSDIDEAAYEVINFLEARNPLYGQNNERRHKNLTRMVKPADDSDSDDEIDQVTTSVRSIPKQTTKHSNSMKPVKSQNGELENNPDNAIHNRIEHLENLVKDLTNVKQSELYSNARQLNPPTKFSQTQGRETRTCYNCGIAGHLSRDCKRPRRQVHQSTNGYHGAAEFIPRHPSTHQSMNPPHYAYIPQTGVNMPNAPGPQTIPIPQAKPGNPDVSRPHLN